MMNRVYKTKNGLTLVESIPYHWQKDSIYYGNTGPYHYYISINPMNLNDRGSLHCSYTEEDGILSVNGEIKIKVNSLEDAGYVVQKMIEGMELFGEITGTIYGSKEYQETHNVWAQEIDLYRKKEMIDLKIKELEQQKIDIDEKYKGIKYIN
jgi:hypothetical protein